MRVGRVPSKQNVLPVAGVLTGALVWGLIWYPYRELQAIGVTGPLATLLTYLLAMLCGAFMLPRVWRERSSFGWWGLLLVLSAGWANFGYVLGMLHGEVMRVLLLFYLAPVWTILFSFWILGERLNRYGYFVVALSLGGAMIMLWEPKLGLPWPQNPSEWLGLSAGMGFALSNVTSRRAAHLSVEAKSFSLWLGTAALTLPFLLWQGGLPGQLAAISQSSWLLLAIMGIVLCTISFAVQYGIAHMPANRAVVLFLFELVVAAVSSYFLAAEAMGWQEWAGAVLIVSASLLSGKLSSAKSLG
ncbi:MAG: DMT family transporter [Gammaproteobacteria bacterium]|nr:DMT family transporter [Gammaproteobacteria bacterium]MBU1967741.1 DMT family transporter [Gammaproteobacteria bacterium]